MMIRSLLPSLAQVQSTFSRQCLAPSAKAAWDLQHAFTPGPQHQQVRTTFILKRPRPLPLSKLHKRTRRMKGPHHIYEFVEHIDSKKAVPLKVLLISSVEGLGTRGDIVETTPYKARNHLILPGLAVYASPENLEKYSHLLKKANNDDEASSPFALKTASEISSRVVFITMNMYNPWKIEPWHVRVAFRKAGVIVPEESITLPSKPIEGPDLNLQDKEFLVKIKINKREEALVRCRVHHVTRKVTDEIPRIDRPYLYHAEPIFPEEGPILEELARKNHLTQFPNGE